MELTHLDKNSNPKMVDVADKDETTRVAMASGIIELTKEAYESIVNETNKKGPVIQTAIIASIMGAKQTSNLIPMCHPLMITSVNCDIEQIESSYSFKLYVTVKTKGQTGVEMEALTGVSIGLLTIYDMVKAIDKGMIIKNVQLESKSGGKNGDFRR
jgi:cyclic pyranopterin phosphate synthase